MRGRGWLRRHERWVVVLSQAVGQLALVAVMPVLTRQFSPSELGVYQTGLAVGLTIQPLATLRAEFVLPALATDQEFRRVLGIAGRTLGGVVLLLAVVASAAEVTGAGGVAGMVAMAALLVLAYGWTAVDNACLIREGRTGRLSARNLVAGLLSAGLQLVVALAWPHAVALAVAILVGRGVAVLVTRSWARRPAPAAVAEGGDREWDLGRGLLGALSGLTASAATQALVLYGSAGFGAGAAAQIGVAQRSAGAPLGLLSQGLSQAMQAGVAPLVRAKDPRVRAAVHRQVKALAPVAFLATVAMAVGGPLLAEPIFGEGWQEAGVIIAILALPSGLQLVVAPIMPVFLMIGRERLLLGLQVVRLTGAVAVAALVQAATGDLLAAVSGFSAASVVWYGATYWTLQRQLRRFGA